MRSERGFSQTPHCPQHARPDSSPQAARRVAETDVQFPLRRARRAELGVTRGLVRVHAKLFIASRATSHCHSNLRGGTDRHTVAARRDAGGARGRERSARESPLPLYDLATRSPGVRELDSSLSFRAAEQCGSARTRPPGFDRGSTTPRDQPRKAPDIRARFDGAVRDVRWVLARLAESRGPTRPSR